MLSSWDRFGLYEATVFKNFVCYLNHVIYLLFSFQGTDKFLIKNQKSKQLLPTTFMMEYN